MFIERVIYETRSVKTILFKDRIASKTNPGQFLMVWIPGVEELPMSIMVADEEDSAAITIRRQGEVAIHYSPDILTDLASIAAKFNLALLELDRSEFYLR